MNLLLPNLKLWADQLSVSVDHDLKIVKYQFEFGEVKNYRLSSLTGFLLAFYAQSYIHDIPKDFDISATKIFEDSISFLSDDAIKYYSDLFNQVEIPKNVIAKSLYDRVKKAINNIRR